MRGGIWTVDLGFDGRFCGCVLRLLCGGVGLKFVEFNVWDEGALLLDLEADTGETCEGVFGRL